MKNPMKFQFDNLQLPFSFYMEMLLQVSHSFILEFTEEAEYTVTKNGKFKLIQNGY